MLLEEFTIILSEQVREKISKDMSVRVNTVYKNNGIKLTGISIVEKNQSISPTIYINKYFERFLDGMELNEIVKDILLIYKESLVNKPVNVDDIMDCEKMSERFAYKLVNYEKNKELLKDVPFIKFLDLAIIFYCVIDTDKLGPATILIHNSHLKLWNITREELIKKARENTPKILPYELRSMYDIIKEMMDEELFLRQKEELNHPVMYVLTNKKKYLGAAVMLYPNILEDFACACQKNLVIIPSSIHEVLLIPVEGIEDEETLSKMVQEVNDLQVEAEEVLSDHIYYFDRSVGEITIP